MLPPHFVQVQCISQLQNHSAVPERPGFHCSLNTLRATLSVVLFIAGRDKPRDLTNEDTSNGLLHVGYLRGFTEQCKARVEHGAGCTLVGFVDSSPRPCLADIPCRPLRDDLALPLRDLAASDHLDAELLPRIRPLCWSSCMDQPSSCCCTSWSTRGAQGRHRCYMEGGATQEGKDDAACSAVMTGHGQVEQGSQGQRGGKTGGASLSGHGSWWPLIRRTRVDGFWGRSSSFRLHSLLRSYNSHTQFNHPQP